MTIQSNYRQTNYKQRNCKQTNYKQTNDRQTRRKNRKGLLKSETRRCFCSWHFFLTMLGVNFGLAASALTTAGMALSVWSPNSYVAIGGSVLLFYFLYSVSLLLPDAISFEWVSSGLQSLPSENPVWVVGYHLIFLLVCNVFTGLFFYYAVRKRYRNGDL